jgi:hypothetical protein
MADAVIGLAAAIEALRAELLSAVGAGWNQPMRFRLDPVELTVQVAVTKEGDGKVGWKILELGGSYESMATQTLTLKLTPIWLQGDGTTTTDFTIAGVGQTGDTFGPSPQQ